MIRVNLLPQKRRVEKTEGSQLWLVVVMLAMLAETAGLVVLHAMKNEELKAQQAANAEIQGQIDQVKKAVSNHDEVKAKLGELRKREDAIAALQTARTGPTAMLLELARVLTPGRGPTIAPERLDELRRDNPLAVYSPGWDARRLWLVSFNEDTRSVELEGRARDGEDVSELARRMNLSAYFYDVVLMPGAKEQDPGTGLSVVNFQLKANVRY